MKHHPLFAWSRRKTLLQTAILTVLVITLIVILNIVASKLEKKYALSADLSFNSMTLQSAVTEETLRALESPVDIYYLTAGTSDVFGGSVILRNDIRTILERYCTYSDQLSLHENSLVRDPLLSTQFSDLLNGASVSEDCIILYCDLARRAKMLTANDMLQYQYDLDSQDYIVTAYAIEKTITEAVLYVSSADIPPAYILSGHGELSASDTAILEKHLSEAGFLPTRVTLLNDMIERSLILILCPQFDITAKELQYLQGFLKTGGGIMYVCGYDCPTDLPNINALLADYGISVMRGIVVATGEDPTSYYSESYATLLPYMQATPETQSLLANRQDILLMPGSRAFHLTDDRDENVYLETLLMSGPAYLRAFEDGNRQLERQDGDETGQFDLAVLARRYTSDGAQGTLICVGCDAMFTEEWIYQNTYQDAFLRTLLQSLSPEKPIALDIAVKSAERAGLTVRSLHWAYIAVFAIPVVILALALLVLIPRRHL